MNKKQIKQKKIELGLIPNWSHRFKVLLVLLLLVAWWFLIVWALTKVPVESRNTFYQEQKEEVLAKTVDPVELVGPVVAKNTTVKTTTARITCYNWTGNPMANGLMPEYGYVATSDRTIPLGTEIIIDGETFIVGDRTNKRIHNEFGILTIDIYMDDCSLDFGAERKEIIINNK